MSIKTKKIIRLLCKIVLALIGLGLIAYLGYFVYRAIVFKPQNVVITNITDASATITWTTSSEMKGVVYYSKDNKIVAGPLGFIGTQRAYDDRDVSSAQVNCVDEFNKNASKTKDSTFSVSGTGYDCTNVKVTKIGSYYTHSITITNLDENSTYYFVVGDSLWSFKDSINTVKTFSTLDKVDEPKPVFGKIVGDDGTYSNDALVYITFNDGSESKDSILYSSTTNSDGGWYLDASNVRDSSGNVIALELANDSFKAKGVYKNYGTSDEVKYVLGYFNGAYPDISVKKNIVHSENVFSKYIEITYAKSTTDSIDIGNPITRVIATATSATKASSTPDPDHTSAKTTVCPACPSFMTVTQYNAIVGGTVSSSTVSSLGYGNVAKALANANGGTLNKKNLETALSGIGVNAGNVNAIAGVTDGSNNKSLETCLNDSSCNVTVNRSTNTITQSYCSGTQTCSKNNSGAVQCLYVNNSCGYKSTNSTTSNTCTNDTCTGSMVCENNSYQYIEGKCGYTKTTTILSDNYNTACGTSTTTSPCTAYCSTHVLECTTKTTSYSVACGSNTSADSCTVYCKSHSDECITKAVQCDVSIYYTGSAGTSNSCKITCGGSSINLTSMEKCKKVTGITSLDDSLVLGNTYEGSYTISASAINPFILSVSRIKTFVDSSSVARNLAVQKMNSLMTQDQDSLTDTEVDTWQKICKALGGSYYSKYDKCSVTSLNIPQTNIVSKAYAADDTSDYSYYLPELGLYDFELDGKSVYSTVAKGNESKLFYVESNSKDGFQMPADPDNPTSDEDILLSSNVFPVAYAQESTAQQYNIKKGINIISFNFMPTSTTSGAYTAKDVISQAKDNGVEIQYMTTFNGGRWSSGYSCSSDTCTGTNFTIVPGVGYLVYATEDGTVTIPGYNLSTPIPVAFSAGWNLVGVNGYPTAYTARTFIDSINTISGLTADNVSWWPTSKAKYEGISVDNGTQYGTDFSISPTNGYFVRISKFAPSDTTCKSLIWQAGGTLNGTCGNTK